MTAAAHASANVDVEAILVELRQRMTRVESRICRIGDHLSVQMRAPKDGLRVIRETAAEVDVSAPVMDITLSELVAGLRKLGIQGKTAHVYFEGRLQATFPALLSER